MKSDFVRPDAVFAQPARVLRTPVLVVVRHVFLVLVVDGITLTEYIFTRFFFPVFEYRVFFCVFFSQWIEMNCICSDGQLEFKNVVQDTVRHLCDLTNDSNLVIVPFSKDRMRQFDQICGGVNSIDIQIILENLNVIDFCSDVIYRKVVDRVCALPTEALTIEIIEKIFKMHSLPSNIDHIFHRLFSLTASASEFFDITKHIRANSTAICHYIDTVSKLYPPGVVASHFISLYGSETQLRDFFDEFIDNFDGFLRRNLLTLYDIECLEAFSEKYNCHVNTLEYLRLLAESLRVPYCYVHKTVDGCQLGVAQLLEYKEKHTIYSPIGTIFVHFDEGISGHVTLKRKFKGKVHLNFVVSEIHRIETVAIGEKTCHFNIPTEFMPDYIYISSATEF